MCVKGSLPLFGFAVGFVMFDHFYDFDEMGSDQVIKRCVVGGDFDVGVPTLESGGLVVVGEVELFESLCKFVRVSFSVVFSNLSKETFDGFGWAILRGLALHV